MSAPELKQNQSRREMRKALIRLRMEMHRQEIRHESRELVNPLNRMRGMTRQFQQGLGIKHAPLWGMAGVVLLGFLTGRGTGGGGSGGLTRLVRLSTSLMPLIKLVMQGPGRKN
ncbi:MAG: hypothetical protein PW845_20430 [Pseudomonas sp.]|uniref:hypothetical protein n=1 Tax=Pseudomonas abieticivorans TaxID=2931382 RepID=UPI0020BE4676|nr:hypothetical protein [Pseudomonas sp. PIA16]MDE1167671.1 hypothetical protein [Pseudomonas sp.]